MTKRRQRSKKKKKINIICIWIIIGIILFSVVGVSLLFILNILPELYFFIGAGIVLLLDILFIGGIFKKNIYLFLLSIIYLVGLFVLSVYFLYTYLFIKGVTNTSTAIEKYEVVVLKNGINNVKELFDKDVGIIDLDDEGYRLATEKLDKEVVYNKRTFNDSNSLVDGLFGNKVDAILIDSVSNEVLRENDGDYYNNTVVIYEIEVTVNINDILKKKNVTKESFNIFISGIDSYGGIKGSSRSDVNILVSINPNTKEVLFTHIPRDYYVTLSGYKSKDKLTHAGIHGIDCSVKSVEGLLDTDINYYIKLNFTSLIDIVNTIGGIEVDSKYSFTTGIYDEKMKKTYTFYKGKNTLYGDEALAFVRERKAFNNGDIVRGENQMLVLEAIIKKCMQPNVLSNYTKLLSSMKNAVVTNMSEDEITSLIKMQLKEGNSWNFESFSLNGTSSYEYTYSYSKQKLYVMIPDYTLDDAKNKINDILKEN